jgi:hypothetical protein
MLWRETIYVHSLNYSEHTELNTAYGQKPELQTRVTGGGTYIYHCILNDKRICCYFRAETGDWNKLRINKTSIEQQRDTFVSIIVRLAILFTILSI